MTRFRRCAFRCYLVGFILMVSCIAPPGAGPGSQFASSGDSKATKADNPFTGARFFINPAFVKNVEAAAAADPANASQILKVAAYPTAIWVASTAAVQEIAPALELAQQQQARGGAPVVPLFVIYDLPNRDCSAAASAGELTVEGGGEQRYRTEFIDQIAAQFQAYPRLKIAAIIEPDSLGNLVTNMNIPRCGASADVYRRSVAYAVSKLSMPHVYLYLDAAHSGWLGWDNNRMGVAQVFRQVLDAAGGVDKIRGFATNVANYTSLDQNEGGKLDTSNPCGNEQTYVKLLTRDLSRVGIENPGFIIDTGRNGRVGIRKAQGSWCNVRGAGIGERPRVSPEPHIDAYYWVKPPGESDGVSDPAAPRFDANCQSPDAAPGAPQAGEWFQSFFIDLVHNANPRL
jgi:cellulose 1,4-beta-cellobiosidase